MPVILEKVDISIIIPVYNVQEYLKECLDSVVNQTIQSKEIIIINDGSTDKSLEIIEDYKNKYSFINVINQENKGISATRNIGVSVATGEYIAFVDSDDFIEKDMFEQMYNVAKKENSDVVICNYKIYNEQAETVEMKEADSTENIDNIEGLRRFLLNDIKAYLWNKIYKRELFNKYNIQFPDFILCEDTPVVFSLFAKSNKITLLDSSLYYYRQRQVSLTKNFSIRAIENILAGCNIMSDYISKDASLNKKLYNYYRVYLIQSLWVIYNKYYIQVVETGQKPYYSDFKRIVSKELRSIKILEIISLEGLSLKYKINALFIKTGIYGFVFSMLNKVRKVSN